MKTKAKTRLVKQPTEEALRDPLAGSPDCVLAFVFVLIYVQFYMSEKGFDLGFHLGFHLGFDFGFVIDFVLVRGWAPRCSH